VASHADETTIEWALPVGVEVGPPAAWELAELDVIALRVQAAHDVAQAAPRVETAAQRVDLGWLLAELAKAEAAVRRVRRRSLIRSPGPRAPEGRAGS
jgi:hypothetical protein